MKLITDEKIIDIINNTSNLKIKKNQIHETFESLGIDSIEYVRIIVELEDYYECEFPDEKLFIREINTVEKIVNILGVLLNNKKQ